MNNTENKIINKELEKIKEDYNNFELGSKNKGFNFNNILKPISKLVIVLILSLCFIKVFNFLDNNISYVSGTWIDEKNNYYEIHDNIFQMNSGDKENPFYEGNITNIIYNKENKEITLLIKGIKYKLEKDKYVYDKDMELIMKINEYTDKLETSMIANMGTEDFNIIRVKK